MTPLFVRPDRSGLNYGVRPVLDHGAVVLVEPWGCDERVIEAARQSTSGAFEGWGPMHGGDCPLYRCVPIQPGDVVDCCQARPGDERLLGFLWRNLHSTPFEMAGLTLLVRAPLLVFREWHRHRTQSYSEMSARYVQMPNDHWNPTVTRIKDGVAAAGSNRQAQGTKPLASDGELEEWIADGERLQQAVYEHYEGGLYLGVPKEVARYNTPVSRYSQMMVSTDLLNWVRFLRLRYHPSAQKEIREYARMLYDIVGEVFPRVHTLLEEERVSWANRK